jgi:20S proteasome alpha/beta subunit
MKNLNKFDSFNENSRFAAPEIDKNYKANLETCKEKLKKALDVLDRAVKKDDGKCKGSGHSKVTKKFTKDIEKFIHDFNDLNCAF